MKMRKMNIRRAVAGAEGKDIDMETIVAHHVKKQDT